jgi:hypothetical protein
MRRGRACSTSSSAAARVNFGPPAYDLISLAATSNRTHHSHRPGNAMQCPLTRDRKRLLQPRGDLAFENRKWKGRHKAASRNRKSKFGNSDCLVAAAARKPIGAIANRNSKPGQSGAKKRGWGSLQLAGSVLAISPIIAGQRR